MRVRLVLVGLRAWSEKSEDALLCDRRLFQRLIEEAGYFFEVSSYFTP